MKRTYLSTTDLRYLLPLSLIAGAFFAAIQRGNFAGGFLAFSFLFLVFVVLLRVAYAWTGAGKTLAIIMALAFLLRLIVGVALHLGLPVFGHDDEDDRAGYVFTDAHRRDDQAWTLATSERPILDAFNRRYASDQYGGLLAFNSLIYRYFSPDAQRPLMLIFFSAFFAALGVPFFWKAVSQIFEEKIAWAAAWIFALYPESILLGASAMREPYLLTFTVFTFWGFVRLSYPADEDDGQRRGGWLWITAGLLGMLLVSPVVALVTIGILAGWVFFTTQGREISWRGVLVVAMVFILGLFLLSSSLNRSGEFDSTSPLRVINSWMKIAVRMNVYEIESGSGWVQKIFDDGPEWIRLPFIAGYGIFQPVLPATVIHPTKPIWTILGFVRGLGWYALLPLLVLSFAAAGAQTSPRSRNLILWLGLITLLWILLAALRGGADLYDNPRYRTILFTWQALLGGIVWVWWRETGNAWFVRVLVMEGIFLLVFTQWYASRYYHWGGQLPFPIMIALILILWGIVVGAGRWWDRKNARRHAERRA